jgi:hypothetical protein
LSGEQRLHHLEGEFTNELSIGEHSLTVEWWHQEFAFSAMASAFLHKY